MNNQQALPILKALARGIDPATGEHLCNDSPFNKADVIRALLCAVDALEPARRQRHDDDRPANAGRSWATEEDQRLLDAFDAGRTPEDLAIQHGRTRGAITSRLVKHGRLQP
ncbi:hypothetical protein B7R78_0022735 [Ralstonia solanacearum]|uniref:Uncharacterized protein n=1 Tax=Ralstonia solanacearum K60 TaxID=1091042 RepID=A0AAP8D206_RALSL|nr:hypothetical protein [Ralstonia solanacearum]MBT1539776.1 hypothetical protein [Ralstonia solanacearum]OYQ09520.1 hypothetical protein B7R77_21760 [Ralstonia solanacearum K60]QOK84049.1 hypothetical protein HF906_18030 [Ralstonia solanacearum]RIJ84438.1 hypothetical protein RSP822_20825 [Ralstonia solanacearum]